MSESPSYLFQYFSKTKDAIDLYGPFEEIDEADIDKADSYRIWSVAEVDDGTHLINGHLKGSAVDFYLKASRDCTQDPQSIDVFISYVTDCLDCDDDECEICDGEGVVILEFADFITFEPIAANSNEDLWEQRKAL
jgi:hypothetical protein